MVSLLLLKSDHFAFVPEATVETIPTWRKLRIRTFWTIRTALTTFRTLCDPDNQTYCKPIVNSSKTPVIHRLCRLFYNLQHKGRTFRSLDSLQLTSICSNPTTNHADWPIWRHNCK